jgi:ElaB/YqjD/DUF883 family membrane-anchored ribosome-binding protein
MGEGPSDVGTMTGGGRSPEELRSEIERTRADLGDTAAALGAKTDVKGRAKDRVEEVRENVAAKAPSSASSAAAQARTTVEENPIPSAAAGALVTGFALGWLLGRRRHA